MNLIEKRIFDEERALYGVRNTTIKDCTFDGPKDGESALKESSDIRVMNCDFRLRYPFWHVKNAHIEGSRMTGDCRAALWYDEDVTLKNCEMDGIKAMRECSDFTIDHCHIHSMEFGWFSRNGRISYSRLKSEYLFLQSRDLQISDFDLQGKYSFQYTRDIVIKDSFLDTKDAFWHAENVTVSNSVLKGEYLGWYSHGLRLVNCKIIGTQPLCYAEGLILEGCEMIGCDLSFEKSRVEADIVGSITSVKNPLSGSIVADGIGEIIEDGDSSGSRCQIRIRKERASAERELVSCSAS